jgi:hypothetical protein
VDLAAPFPGIRSRLLITHRHLGLLSRRPIETYGSDALYQDTPCCEPMPQ